MSSIGILLNEEYDYFSTFCWIQVTGSAITGNDVTVTSNERENISRAYYPYFPSPPVFRAVFSGASLDSRYEQWLGIIKRGASLENQYKYNVAR